MNSYVMLILYSAMSSNGWGSTKLHQEFPSMRECERVLADYRMSLGNKVISGQCYYRGQQQPSAADCKALQQFSFKWTNKCLQPGNDVMRQCQFLEAPAAPYNLCTVK